MLHFTSSQARPSGRRWAGLLFLSLWIFTAMPAGATPPAQIIVELGPEETVFDWTVHKCEQEDIPDLAARAFVDADGKVQLLAGHYTSYRSIGDNLDDVQRDCAQKVLLSHKNATPRLYDDFEWLVAPYTEDGITIHALVHNEYHGWDHANCNSAPAANFNCWWNAITMVRSTDRGVSYPHATPLLPPAHVVASSPVDYDPDNTTGPFGYFAGSNIIRAADGYYYAFLHVEAKGAQDWGVCLMRAQTVGVPSSWRGYDGAAFTVALDKGVCPTVSRPQIAKTSGHVSFNDYLGEYILVGAAGEPTNFHFSTSPTLTSWQQRAVLMQTDLWWTPNATTRRAYPTLLQPGDATRNFERTGRSPWLYYTYHDDTRAPLDRDLLRRRVRFSLPGEQSRYDVLSLRANEQRGSKTLDASFYGNDGALQGAVTFSTDHIEGSRALSFGGGAGDRVEVAHHASLDLSGSLTIEAFVKLTATHANQWAIIAAKDGGGAGARNYGLFVAPSSFSTPGVLHFSFSAAGNYVSSVGTQRVDDGGWHHVAVSYTDSDQTARYYVDGVLDVARVHGAALGDGKNSSSLLVGSFLSGAVDALVVHNYVRSAAQIAEDAKLLTPPAVDAGVADGSARDAGPEDAARRDAQPIDAATDARNADAGRVDGAADGGREAGAQDMDWHEGDDPGTPPNSSGCSCRTGTGSAEDLDVALLLLALLGLAVVRRGRG